MNDDDEKFHLQPVIVIISMGPPLAERLTPAHITFLLTMLISLPSLLLLKAVWLQIPLLVIWPVLLSVGAGVVSLFSANLSVTSSSLQDRLNANQICWLLTLVVFWAFTLVWMALELHTPLLITMTAVSTTASYLTYASNSKVCNDSNWRDLG